MCITQQPCHRTLLTSLLQMPSFLDSSIRTSVSRSNHPAKPTSNVDHSRCTIMSIPSVMSYVDPQPQLVNVIGVFPSPLTGFLGCMGFRAIYSRGIRVCFCRVYYPFQQMNWRT